MHRHLLLFVARGQRLRALAAANDPDSGAHRAPRPSSYVPDRRKNQKIGKSVPRFVERIHACDRVVVVGTPDYRRKYDNEEPMGGFVVAAEGDLIGQRMIGSEEEKESVLPVLLAGTKEEASFPPLLHGRVYADFRDEHAYFRTAFDLILSLYDIPAVNPAVADLRESLSERE